MSTKKKAAKKPKKSKKAHKRAVVKSKKTKKKASTKTQRWLRRHKNVKAKSKRRHGRKPGPKPTMKSRVAIVFHAPFQLRKVLVKKAKTENVKLSKLLRLIVTGHSKPVRVAA